MIYRLKELKHLWYGRGGCQNKSKNRHTDLLSPPFENTGLGPRNRTSNCNTVTCLCRFSHTRPSRKTNNIYTAVQHVSFNRKGEFCTLYTYIDAYIDTSREASSINFRQARRQGKVHLPAKSTVAERKYYQSKVQVVR